MIISALNHASWLCLMIMASLLFLSVYSWTLIIRKVNEIDKQKKLMTEFDMQFGVFRRFLGYTSKLVQAVKEFYSNSFVQVMKPV